MIAAALDYANIFVSISFFNLVYVHFSIFNIIQLHNTFDPEPTTIRFQYLKGSILY